MEVKDNRNISGYLLIYHPKKHDYNISKKCDKKYEAKYAMFVYFCYVGMEFEKFKVTIVKQWAIYRTSANFLTPKFSQNVVLGLNINIRQKSGKAYF